jgi:hypothetical protein
MIEQELWPKRPLKLIRPNLSVHTRYVRMRECRPMYVWMYAYMYAYFQATFVFIGF